METALVLYGIISLALFGLVPGSNLNGDAELPAFLRRFQSFSDCCSCINDGLSLQCDCYCHNKHHSQKAEEFRRRVQGLPDCCSCTITDDLTICNCNCDGDSNTPAPSLPPRPEIPSFALCFSGSSTVLVRGKGPTAMKEVELGDYVQVAFGKYEQVYSFGHFNPSARASFLEIKTSANSKALQISKEHMIFTLNRGFIPAGLLNENDALGGLNQSKPVSIEEITSITGIGLFAPFTPSGTLIVNGVLVSSFVAFDQKSSYHIGPVAISYQWLAHSFEFLHRVVCHYTTKNGFCKNEKYGNDGINEWEVMPLHFSTWVLGLNALLKHAFFLLFFFVLSLFCIIEECTVNFPSVNGAALLIGAALWLFCKRNHK